MKMSIKASSALTQKLLDNLGYLNGLDALLVYVSCRDDGIDLRHDVRDWGRGSFYANICTDISAIRPRISFRDDRSCGYRLPYHHEL